VSQCFYLLPFLTPGGFLELPLSERVPTYVFKSTRERCFPFGLTQFSLFSPLFLRNGIIGKAAPSTPPFSHPPDGKKSLSSTDNTFSCASVLNQIFAYQYCHEELFPFMISSPLIPAADFDHTPSVFTRYARWRSLSLPLL